MGLTECVRDVGVGGSPHLGRGYGASREHWDRGSSSVSVAQMAVVCCVPHRGWMLARGSRVKLYDHVQSISLQQALPSR